MRHLNAMPAVMREQIENTIATTDTTKIMMNSEPPDYAAAHANLEELNRKGKLNDSTINRFAVRGEYTNIVAALSLKTGSPVDVILPLLAADNIEGLVLACKASRLDWATAAAILRHRPGQSPVPSAELEKARKTYNEFSLSAAQRTVRF
jgi:Flp pilus assembly CpaF family ATPase